MPKDSCKKHAPKLCREINPRHSSRAYDVNNLLNRLESNQHMLCMDASMGPTLAMQVTWAPSMEVSKFFSQMTSKVDLLDSENPRVAKSFLKPIWLNLYWESPMKLPGSQWSENHSCDSHHCHWDCHLGMIETEPDVNLRTHQVEPTKIISITSDRRVTQTNACY